MLHRKGGPKPMGDWDCTAAERWCTSRPQSIPKREGRMAQISGLMQGKRGGVLGVANNRSIAWAIAKPGHGAGAGIALTWQGDPLKTRVEPLAGEIGGLLLGHCDVTD